MFIKFYASERTNKLSYCNKLIQHKLNLANEVTARCMEGTASFCKLCFWVAVSNLCMQWAIKFAQCGANEKAAVVAV